MQFTFNEKKKNKHLKSSAIDSVMSFCQICYIEAQVKGLVFNLLFVQHFYIICFYFVIVKARMTLSQEKAPPT